MGTARTMFFSLNTLYFQIFMRKLKRTTNLSQGEVPSWIFKQRIYIFQHDTGLQRKVLFCLLKQYVICNAFGFQQHFG